MQPRIGFSSRWLLSVVWVLWIWCASCSVWSSYYSSLGLLLLGFRCFLRVWIRWRFPSAVPRRAVKVCRDDLAQLSSNRLSYVVAEFFALAHILTLELKLLLLRKVLPSLMSDFAEDVEKNSFLYSTALGGPQRKVSNVSSCDICCAIRRECYAITKLSLPTCQDNALVDAGRLSRHQKLTFGVKLRFIPCLLTNIHVYPSLAVH